MKAMILAAGRGERMRPLTDFTPKPLLKVGGKPLIVWHLERLAQAGFKEIVINHAHLGEQIEQALGNGAEWGLNIQYSPVLVVNGDTFTEIDFQQVANHFKSAALQPQGLSPQNISAKADYSCLQANIHAGAGHALKLAHLVLVDNPPQHPNGDFAIEFKSKSGGMLKNEGAQMRTFSGVGVYHPDLFADVTKGQPAKLAPLLRKAIENNAATAHHYQGVWHDIGTPERLIKLDDSLLRV
jgi:N-acetyl-alpha-D-muramate 1-phosphate uridylyltransferase